MDTIKNRTISFRRASSDEVIVMLSSARNGYGSSPAVNGKTTGPNRDTMAIEALAQLDI